MNTIRFSTLAIAVMGVATFATGAGAQQALMNGAKNNAVALSPDEQWALNEALQDEYKARAAYARVIETFGEVRPFSNIIHAESRHIGALVDLYNHYGLSVPEDTWSDRAPVFSSLEEACAAAVQAELDNAALYDEIADKVSNPDLLHAFAALQDASVSRHLPAFERSLKRGNGRGRGDGQGCGMGNGRGRGGQGHGMGYGRGRGDGQGHGMGCGRGHGDGQGHGMGCGRGRGDGQGHGMGCGRGQSGQDRGMGHGRGQCGSNGAGSRW